MSNRFNLSYTDHEDLLRQELQGARKVFEGRLLDRKQAGRRGESAAALERVPLLEPAVPFKLSDELRHCLNEHRPE